jgi:hypothetical protein
VETVAGDDGALWITLTLTVGAAGRVVRRAERRRCTLLVRTATASWSRCFWPMRGWTSIRLGRCVWEGRARAGGDSGQAGRWVRCRAQCVSRRRATGAPISREASVRVESCVFGIGVRGLYGDGGSGTGGRRHGRRWESRGAGGSNAGVKTVAGDDRALWITLTLMAGAAGRVVCRMDGRHCLLLVRRATARWSRCFWLMRGWA